MSSEITEKKRDPNNPCLFCKDTDEVAACMDLINEEKKLIDDEFNPDG